MPREKILTSEDLALVEYSKALECESLKLGMASGLDPLGAFRGVMMFYARQVATAEKASREMQGAGSPHALCGLVRSATKNCSLPVPTWKRTAGKGRAEAMD